MQHIFPAYFKGKEIDSYHCVMVSMHARQRNKCLNFEVSATRRGRCEGDIVCLGDISTEEMANDLWYKLFSFKGTPFKLTINKLTIFF